MTLFDDCPRPWKLQPFGKEEYGYSHIVDANGKEMFKGSVMVTADASLLCDAINAYQKEEE